LRLYKVRYNPSLNFVSVARVFLDCDIHAVHVGGLILEGDVEFALKNPLRYAASDVDGFGHCQNVLQSTA